MHPSRNELCFVEQAMNRILAFWLVMMVVGLSGIGSAFAQDCCVPEPGTPCEAGALICRDSSPVEVIAEDSQPATAATPKANEDLVEPPKPISPGRPSGVLADPLELKPEWEPWDGSTMALQVLGGVVGGAVGLLPGAATGSGEVALVSMLLGSTAGIGMAGYLSGGNGSLLLTGVGVAAGFAVGFYPALYAFLIATLSSKSLVPGIVIGVGILGPATIGAGLIAYHVSASPVGSVSVGFHPTQGGAMATFGGRF